VEKEAEEEEVVFGRGMEWNAGRSILRECDSLAAVSHTKGGSGQ
jgi:hypothetical protein